MKRELLVDYDGYIYKNKLICSECADERTRLSGDRPSLQSYSWDEVCALCGQPLLTTDIRGLAILLNGRTYGAAKKLSKETGATLPTVRSWMSGTKLPSATARKVLRDLARSVGVRVTFKRNIKQGEEE